MTEASIVPGSVQVTSMDYIIVSLCDEIATVAVVGLDVEPETIGRALLPPDAWEGHCVREVSYLEDSPAGQRRRVLTWERVPTEKAAER